jgi:hypothetical protein
VASTVATLAMITTEVLLEGDASPSYALVCTSSVPQLQQSLRLLAAMYGLVHAHMCTQLAQRPANHGSHTHFKY